MPDEKPVDATVTPAEGATPSPDEQLGESGLKALKAERERAAAAEKLAADREAKLREYEDRDKSEEQKAQEERDRLQKEIADLRVGRTRAEVAASSTVPVDILAGPASDSEADIKAFADSLLAWHGDVQPQRLHVPSEGKTPTRAGGSTADAFAAFAEGKL